ncbi:MAG TPA: Ig-like domain-containing protein [Marmoricola sp.]
MKLLLRLLTAVAAALVACTSVHLLGSGVGFSGATWVSSTSSRATVSAARDWTPPTVSLSDPGPGISGTVTLAAAASDNVAVHDVRFQYSVSGSGAWTGLCTVTAAPYTCSWNTTAVADGAYDLRAVATDTSGYTASSVASTQVVNTLRVVLTNPGDLLHGATTVSARIYNTPLSLLTTFEIDSAPAGGTKWTPICASVLASTLSCSWNTPATGSYDVRAYAVVNGTSYTDTATDVLVDNTAPTVSLTNPGSTLSGVVTLATTATDADSGLVSVEVQYARAGTSTWTDVCTATAAPWSCRWNTTTVAGGSYDLRAIAVDNAGNSATSALVRGITVDNTVNSVSLNDPGAYLSGAVVLTANAASTNGVGSVQVQQRPAGSTTYTTICTTGTSPYGCTWDTTKVANGAYELRAFLTDAKGNTLASAVVSTTVDNSPLRAVDVQTTNGGSIVGRVQPGDTVQLTWSTTVQTTSVASGWDGSSRSITVQLSDNGMNDTLGFPGTNLGTLALGQNYVKKAKTVTFAATTTAATVTASGVQRSVVTVTLGAQTGGGTVTAPGAATIVWTPSSLLTSLAGVACSTSPATESGTTDKDF